MKERAERCDAYLGEDVAVGGHVGGEGVDGPPVVNDEEEDGQALLGRRVEALSHAPVLRATLADEDDGDAVVALGARGVEVAVEKNGSRSAHGIGQLLRHQRPPALEVGVDVVDVHRPARALARAVHLGWGRERGEGGSVKGKGKAACFRAFLRVSRFFEGGEGLTEVILLDGGRTEELGHDAVRLDARGEGVGVLAVVAVLDVALPQECGRKLRRVSELQDNSAWITKC